MWGGAQVALAASESHFDQFALKWMQSVTEVCEWEP